MQAAWYSFLFAGLTALAYEPPLPPPPAGESEDRANLTFWFVDDPRTIQRWNDRAAFDHSRLLEILRNGGSRPRIEHIGEAELPARWKDAIELGRTPQVVAAMRWIGEVKNLDQAGAMRSVGSQRLAFDELAHPDLARRFPMLPRAAAHQESTRKALHLLLKISETPRLPGPALPVDAGRLDAELAARRAASAYLEGDPTRLKAIASARSSQLIACTVPNRWQAGLKVRTEDVVIRGCRSLAVAVVECSFEGDRILGADPVAIVLTREGGRWKALTISHDLVTVKNATAALCLALAGAEASEAGPAEPRLVEPADGRDLSAASPFLAWTVPAGGEPVLVQVFEHHFGDSADGDARWPEARLEVYPPEPRGGKVNPFAGVVGSNMSWTVWAVGRGGQIAVAPARRFGIGR